MLRQTRVPLTLPKVCENCKLCPSFCALCHAVQSSLYALLYPIPHSNAKTLSHCVQLPHPCRHTHGQHACHGIQVLVVSCNLKDKADMAWWAAHRDGDGAERPWLPGAVRVSCDSQEWQVSLTVTHTSEI